MALKIKQTGRAIDDFDSILKFLESEWNEKIIIRFIRILTSKLDLISYFPGIGFRIFEDKEVRALSITKHSRLYYRVKNTIIILRLFDTRKDPSRFTF